MLLWPCQMSSGHSWSGEVDGHDVIALQCYLWCRVLVLTSPLHMVLKRVKRIVSYAKTGYGAYRALRRVWRNRPRRRRTYRRTKSVSFKAMTSKKYGAKMNKLFRVGRI